MSKAGILSAVFLGRLIKYSTFGLVATSSPGLLRYLGVKVGAAGGATAGDGGEGGHKKGK